MYDLTVDPRKFATEQILTCSSADYDKDYTQISTEDAARLCKADTSNSVKFWTNKKSAHGGFRHQFDKLLGSMGVAAVGEEAMKSRYYKVQDKPGREAHDRNVLGRGRFRNAQEWSAWPVHLETSASFVGPDVRGWRAWLVCCSILCLCALNVKCCVCEKQAVLLRAVWGCVCKQAAVEQSMSCGALMCHVVGAACSPDL